jgi:hypothetical protein
MAMKEMFLLKHLNNLRFTDSTLKINISQVIQ